MANSDSFLSPKVQVCPPMPWHTARDLMEQVQWFIPGDAFQLPRAWVCRSVVLPVVGIHTPTISRSPLVFFGGFHTSFFGIRAHLFATSSPPPKSLPDKQPAPNYFLLIPPGFATAILNCGISDDITQAVTALHGVTGRDTRCGQPGSPRLATVVPLGLVYLLQLIDTTIPS